MEKGSTLAECLSRTRSHHFHFAALKSELETKESVLVRDVLQMLQGFSSSSFQWDSNGKKFALKKGLYVSHLSPSSLQCILYRFMHSATCLQRADCFVKDVESASSADLLNPKRGFCPTLQAFANAVSVRLKCLRKVALDMELKCSGDAAGTTVTLLGLVEALQRVCAGAEFLSEIINGTIPHNNQEDMETPAELATHLLNYLYKKLNDFCLIQDGEDEPYQTVLLLFIGSLRPLMESLDSWLYEGTLSDPYHELFFYANVEVAVEDSTFWEKGYLLHERESAKPESSAYAMQSSALHKGDRKGGSGYGSPQGSPMKKNKTKKVPNCPIFIQSIAREIVSAGKSIQLMRYVQSSNTEICERADIFKNTLAGTHEHYVSSAIWMPFFTGRLSKDKDDSMSHDEIMNNFLKPINLMQANQEINESKLSLFETFSTTLVRLLGYTCDFESGSIARKDFVRLPSTSGSLASDDECWKSKFLRGLWCDLRLNAAGEKKNDLSQENKNTEQEAKSQSEDVGSSHIETFFKPQNAAFSVSARDIQQNKELWEFELNLSKCSLLPSLNDGYLRKAIYCENEMGTLDKENLSLPVTDESEDNKNHFQSVAEQFLDSRAGIPAGTNFMNGFGFGKSALYNMKADAKALELLYPFPTLLPKVEESSLISELLPSQMSSNLASKILNWLQTVKLKPTLLPPVLVQESLIYFIKQQVDHVGKNILFKLMDEWRLMDELAVLRATFLFGSGDLLQQFCAMLFNKLDKGDPWDDYYELNTMLQESIRSSADGMLLPSLDSLAVTIVSTSDDDEKSNARKKVARGHGFGLEILDSLEFSYKVPWPLELIINHAAIQKYNQVMVFLLKVKRAKFALDKARRWMWKKGGNISPGEKQHLLLQQKLMHFVNTFHQYVMDRVLYSSWIELCQGMASAASLDEAIACHETYLVSVQKQCFVAPDKLWALIANRVKLILSLALDFYSIQNTLYNGGAAPAIKTRCQIEVDRVDHQFDECIVFLLRVLSFKLNVGHFPHLVDLVTRINYNYHFMTEAGHLLTPLPETTTYHKASTISSSQFKH